jgi:16S rRNA (guanine(966)-N(2))-methyltransferase RsmD
MIRITTGTAKNVKLETPKIPDYRAVQEVAKNALFNIIGDKVVGADCLDLYAGSGNLGLEALSRGASRCDFVDDHKEARNTIIENIGKCGLSQQSEFHLKDAVKYAANTNNKYDLIFVDPFYHTTSHIFLMKNLEEILKPQGLICFFHADNLKPENLIKDTSLQIIDQRKFGQSYFTLLKIED